MRQVFARPEQTQTLAEFIKCALHDAALAPTDAAALDIADDALCRLADLIPLEMTHA